MGDDERKDDELEAKLREGDPEEVVQFDDPAKDIQDTSQSVKILTLLNDERIEEAKELIEQSSGLDKEIGLQLIELGYGYFVFLHYENFSGLIYQKKFLPVVSDACRADLRDFGSLNKELLIVLIMNGYCDFVADNLERIKGLDKSVAMALIREGRGDVVMENHEKFSGLVLGQELATYLMNHAVLGYDKLLADNLDQFSGLDKDIALQLITVRYSGAVVGNEKVFGGFDRDLIFRLIEAGQSETVYHLVANLDIDIALRMIMCGYGWVVIDHPEDFAGLVLDKETALELIEYKQGRLIVDNIEKFPWPKSEFSDPDLYEKSKKDLFYLIGSDQAPSFTEQDWAHFCSDGAEQSGLHKVGLPEINAYRSEFDRLEDMPLVDEESSQKLFEFLKGKQLPFNDWSDIYLCDRFRDAGERFGFVKMFEYMKNASLHDAFYNMAFVIKLQEEAGLSSHQFYGQILHQVSLDKSTYDESGKSSHQKFGEIASAVLHDFDIEASLEDLKALSGLPEVQRFLEKVSKPADVFQSWKTLLSYHGLITIVQNKALVEKLSHEPNEKLKSYVSTLVFDPAVSDKEAVRLFWEAPGKFYDLQSSYTPEAVHDRKKPSNYTDIPYLGMGAVELRNALVEGSLDAIQAWEPLMITYTVPTNAEFIKKTRETKLLDFMTTAIGKREKRDGKVEYVGAKAAQPALLLKNLEIFLRTRGLNLRRVFEGLRSGELKLDEEIEQQLREIVLADRAYQKQLQLPPEEYRAQIFLKSNPEGVVAGNDTACCMPFGDGKNTVYTFNPVCAQFVIQKKRQDGTFRTIAQSVLTQDRDVKVNVGEMRRKIQKDGDVGALYAMVPEDVLGQSKLVVACDSMEIAPNSQGPEQVELIKKLYKDALAEYLKQNDKEGKFEHRHGVVGKFNSHLLHLPVAPNTFLPMSPVSYSDKYGDEVLVLDMPEEKIGHSFYLAREVIETKRPETNSPQQHYSSKKLQALTYMDTLPTAYLEGKVYRSTSLTEGLHNMQNMLIAKDIKNAHRGLADMSMKYVESNGRMGGYLLAYEGVLPAGEHGEPCIYIADLAANPESKRAGGTLMLEFMKQYKRHYADPGDLLPIFAHMRETTSYQLMKDNLQKMAERIGLQAIVEEKPAYGKDNLHPVLIRFQKAA